MWSWRLSPTDCIGVAVPSELDRVQKLGYSKIKCRGKAIKYGFASEVGPASIVRSGTDQRW